MWAFTRMDYKQTDIEARATLEDRDASVRQAACQALALRKDKEATPKLIELVRHDEPWGKAGSL